MEQINYYKRGLSKAKLEDYEGAIEDFSKAIELDQILYEEMEC